MILKLIFIILDYEYYNTRIIYSLTLRISKLFNRD